MENQDLESEGKSKEPNYEATRALQEKEQNELIEQQKDARQLEKQQLQRSEKPVLVDNDMELDYLLVVSLPLRAIS